MVIEDAALLNRRVTHMTPAALFSRRLRGHIISQSPELHQSIPAGGMVLVCRQLSPDKRGRLLLVSTRLRATNYSESVSASNFPGTPVFSRTRSAITSLDNFGANITAFNGSVWVPGK